MHRVLTALRRGFKEQLGWKRLGIVASLLIIGLAITHLINTLKGVDTGVILAALTEIATQIALAALCVVGAFCTLTFYDFFALRTIGKRHVPYRIAALSRLHLLYDRPQYRRHGVHRRRDPVSDLFGLRPVGDRRRENLLHLRADLLARQSGRARHRHGLASLGGSRWTCCRRRSTG